MSQQDVDTIKGAYEAFARQDVEGVMAAFDDTVKFKEYSDMTPLARLYDAKATA